VQDNVIGEIGIGFCFVCSYGRKAEVAEEAAYQLDMERAIQRAVERDD
jgi:type 1 glutamine amidotransferase